MASNDNVHITKWGITTIISVVVIVGGLVSWVLNIQADNLQKHYELSQRISTVETRDQEKFYNINEKLDEIKTILRGKK